MMLPERFHVVRLIVASQLLERGDGVLCPVVGRGRWRSARAV
jgi:hypothetical protein